MGPRHFCQSDWSCVCRLESGSRRTFVGSTKYFRLLTLVISLGALGRSGYRLCLYLKLRQNRSFPDGRQSGSYDPLVLIVAVGTTIAPRADPYGRELNAKGDFAIEWSYFAIADNRIVGIGPVNQAFLDSRPILIGNLMKNRPKRPQIEHRCGISRH